MRQGREMASGSIQAPLCLITEAKTYLFLIPFASKVRIDRSTIDRSQSSSSSAAHHRRRRSSVFPRPSGRQVREDPQGASRTCTTFAFVTAPFCGFKSRCLTVLPGHNTTLPSSSISRSDVASVFDAHTAVAGRRPCLDPVVSHTGFTLALGVDGAPRLPF